MLLHLNEVLILMLVVTHLERVDWSAPYDHYISSFYVNLILVDLAAALVLLQLVHRA